MIGTAQLEPKCGTWKKHWIKYARKKWPKSAREDGVETEQKLELISLLEKVVGNIFFHYVTSVI